MEISDNRLSRELIGWLDTLGYPTSGKPDQALLQMFLWEAAQWRLAPEELERLVHQLFIPPKSDFPTWAPLSESLTA